MLIEHHAQLAPVAVEQRGGFIFLLSGLAQKGYTTRANTN